MKRLFLLRHAKAEAKDARHDAERVLAPRGRRDMTAMAAHLAREGVAPDLAFVSPAARTRETWTLAGLPGTPTVVADAIYEASPEALLELVRGADDAAGSLILVGHNPGLEELAAMLVGRKRAREVATMPTGTLVTIDVEAASWSGVAAGTGTLAGMVTPEGLGAGRDA